MSLARLPVEALLLTVHPVRRERSLQGPHGIFLSFPPSSAWRRRQEFFRDVWLCSGRLLTTDYKAGVAISYKLFHFAARFNRNGFAKAPDLIAEGIVEPFIDGLIIFREHHEERGVHRRVHFKLH